MKDRRVPWGARGRSCRKGTSFAEIMIVVAVIGIMAAIAIPMIFNVVPSASRSTAEKNLNDLNSAVLAFNQANWELVLSPSSGSDDELAIFRSLRYRNAAQPSPGSPYLPPNTSFHASSDSETYRASWNGRMFEMIEVGDSGTGLNLLGLIDGPAQEMVYEEGYQPVAHQP